LLRKLHITSDFFNSELPRSDLEDLDLKMFSDAPNLTEVHLFDGIPAFTFDLP
jgi:hypothetical protein